jgi:hypothetical protein
LNLLVTPVRTASLEEQARGRLAELRDHCPGWRLLGLENHFTSSGALGKLVDFEWLAEGVVVRQRQLLLSSLERAYTWTATWPSEAAPEPEDPLSGALLSFELLEVD